MQHQSEQAAGLSHARQASQAGGDKLTSVPEALEDTRVESGPQLPSPMSGQPPPLSEDPRTPEDVAYRIPSPSFPTPDSQSSTPSVRACNIAFMA